MKIIKVKNYDEMSETAAKIIIDVVKNNPIFGNNIAPTIDSNNFNLILTIKILLY